MSLINTYANLSDVRRILRSTPAPGRVRFSDSYNMLKSGVDNSSDIQLLSIDISDDFADNANYEFKFLDTTTFTFVKNDGDTNTNIFLGTGYVQEDFSSEDDSFVILSSSWSGSPLAGDKIEFGTNSHISINDGSRYIQDAEFFVDSILEKSIRFTSSSETLVFDTTNVPKAVNFATTRIACYLIYKSLYIQNNIEKGTEAGYTAWLKEGFQVLQNYVDKFNLSLSTSAPVLGHYGTNHPVDLTNDFNFKSSVMNLAIGILTPQFTSNYFVERKAFNFLMSGNYADSITADILKSL